MVETGRDLFNSVACYSSDDEKMQLLGNFPEVMSLLFRQVATRCFAPSGSYVKLLPVRLSRSVGLTDVPVTPNSNGLVRGSDTEEKRGVARRGVGAPRDCLSLPLFHPPLELFILAQIALPTSTAKLTSANFYDAFALTPLRRHPHGQNFNLYEGLPNSV